MPEANESLRAARERLPSRRVPGEAMGRAELAEAVNARLWNTTGKRFDLDARAVARWERGAVRWPGAHYRAALRHVLGAADDAALGFRCPSPTRTAAIAVGSDLRTSTDLGGILMATADESSDLLARAEATNVGDLTVEQLHSDVRRTAASYLQVDTLPLFARTRAVRDRAFSLLDGRQRPDQTRDLYAAAGWSLTLLAWMTTDLGRPDIAEAHCRTAWACAENADHDGLRAWVRATQHTAAFWQNDHQRAARYAADGLAYATGSARTFLASAYALDTARLGRTADAREALVVAQRAADASDPTRDDLAGPFTCRAERAAGFWSDVALSLGQPEITAEHADAAVARLHTLPAEARNPGSERMIRLQQVKARLALGELDGAADALAPVMATAPEHRVRPLMARLAEVGAASAAFPGERIAQRIGSEVAEFIRHPVVAELTA
ncbi:Tetratricopeptide TPR_4 [Alloactinosynnema sp. L-07]|uniref:hypothetical protein n=1 Tax=Alloactinosynnema sp. L-07 TaxID=1653480 RepID=UPI00065EFCF1|nr:hypothetical protein [Alloactinosynnema sp. L-07]CRK61809.1 Tetratricopeptide TPR_4 [Alloactinosynnema sp. L-07]